MTCETQCESDAKRITVGCETQCDRNAKDRGQRTEDRGTYLKTSDPLQSLPLNRLPPSLRSVAIEHPCRTHTVARNPLELGAYVQTAHASGANLPVDQEPDLGRCICGRWPLYIGAYDGHGRTVRCYGCKRIPSECWCALR